MLSELNSKIEKGDENEIFDPIATKSSVAKQYKIQIGHANLSLVYTPSLVDASGPSLDRKAFEEVKKAVIALGGINCICIV